MAANLSLPSAWYSKKGRKHHSEHICKSWTFSFCVSCIFNITPLPTRPRHCFNIHCSVRSLVLVPTNLIQDPGNFPSLFGPRMQTLYHKEKCKEVVCSALVLHCPPLTPYLLFHIHVPEEEDWLCLHLKRPWCWERLKAGEEGDNRGWDGWMISLTQWTWVWVNSGSWLWTGRPGVLRFIGSQRVGHDRAIELNRMLSSMHA